MSARKKCIKCGEVKALADFAWKRKNLDQRTAKCKSCQATYQKDHYERNRDVYLARTARRNRETRDERTKLIVDYLKKHPCVDCGETNVIVLDFDHLYDKSFNISGGLQSRRWEAVLEEIEKCEVVCANCHRHRTYARNPSLRSQLAKQAKSRAGDR